MKSLQLKEDLYWVGVLDKDLRVFDIIMYTEFGTTYNSYVLKGSEKTVLFETAKLKFFDDYLETLSDIVDVKDVDYIIVSHTEPDHVGSIEKILEINPSVKIIGTATAINFLKQIVNRDFYSLAVKEGDTISLGNKTLQFMPLPNLHWPDTMYTYIEEDKVLVTCDSFGSHYAHDGILKSTVTDEEGYMRATKYYFDNIIGPFKQPYMAKALKRIENLEIDMICTGHGPVLDTGLEEFIKTYGEWCRVDNPNTKKTVIIPYVSAYGYTGMLAEKIMEGIKRSGDVEVRSYDMVVSDQGKVLEEIAMADGVLFGTPTILAEALNPIWQLTINMFPPTHSGKLASAFGSYGWSGEAVPHMTERLKQLRMKVLDGFRVRLKPSEKDLVDAFEFGYDFGCVLQSKENDRKETKKTSGLVKCLICGEIFPEGAENCPVCGVGPENFVPVSEDAVTFKKNTDENFLILGGGTAAFNAAAAIRERNETATIILISEENALPYNRPMLTKNMFADLMDGQIAIQGEDWYKENNIQLILGRKITKLNSEEKEVTLENGYQFHYDKCIYALGSHCFIPPIPGTGLPEVVAVRSLTDIQKLKDLIKTTRNAVVIGGGVLGLEAAWELTKAKCQVTVLEASDRLLSKRVDAVTSKVLAGILERNGIKLITEASTESIQGDAHVAGVRLQNGVLLPAELVIISAGVRSNAGIAKEAKIEVERAIVVNDGMATNKKDIFACGDCAEYMGTNFAVWPEATEMGKVAGANAAGDSVKYMIQQPAMTLTAFNTTLFIMGDNGGDPEKVYKTVEFKDDTKNTLEKYYFYNNGLCGVTLLGDISKMGALTEAVEERKKFQDLF